MINTINDLITCGACTKIERCLTPLRRDIEAHFVKIGHFLFNPDLSSYGFGEFLTSFKKEKSAVKAEHALAKHGPCMFH